MTATPRSIVLIGFMGSGKSSVGKLLARELGWPRFETDKLVAEKLRRPIPEIFAELGEERFRATETEVLQHLAPPPPAIIVTGGGIVLRRENRECLCALGTVVWLTASLPVLAQRLAHEKDRPLLPSSDRSATIRRLLAERQPLYEAVAEVTIDTSSLDPAQVAEAIRREIENLRSRS